MRPYGIVRVLNGETVRVETAIVTLYLKNGSKIRVELFLDVCMGLYGDLWLNWKIFRNYIISEKICSGCSYY